MSFSDMPVDVGPVYEGERIRANQMYVELGGPKVDKKFELVRVKPESDIEDDKVILIGPDLTDMEKGSRHPIGIFVEVAGPELEEDLEAVFERRIHEFCNFVNGVMHLNQRYTNWMRVSTAAYEKGLNSLKMLGTILIRLFKAELGIIKKAQVTLITDPKEIEGPHEMAMGVYDARDERARGLHDEDVDMYYGCVLCQSFAPTHACCITPDRTSLCGSISWFDARAAAKVDPKGPLYEVPPGKCLNAEAGEFEGVNAMIKKRSLGEIERIFLYSGMEFPHTSCGCFEAIDFFLPETGIGHGIIDRNHEGVAINGLPFSAMANQTGGGKQLPGFNGISIQYVLSPKYQQYDGGVEMVVWMGKSIKDRIGDMLPKELADKIATEEDVTDVNELIKWLQEKKHPIIETDEFKAALSGDDEDWEEEGAMIPMGTMGMTIPGVGGSGGFKIILKNCKIHAESVIIKKVETRRKKK